MYERQCVGRLRQTPQRITAENGYSQQLSAAVRTPISNSRRSPLKRLSETCRKVAGWYSLCVPDWKRVIVGDAFQLPSRDFNYYRDLFLLWPFLLFTIASLVNLFGVGHDHRVGLKFLALSLVTIFLARERFILIGGALGFCAAQSGISFVLKHDWIALAVSICSSTLCLLLFRSLKDYKPSYSRPKGILIADILTGLTSLGLTLALFSWIRR